MRDIVSHYKFRKIEMWFKRTECTFIIKFTFFSALLVILLNILGIRANFTRPIPNYEIVNRSAKFNLTNFEYVINTECKNSKIVWIVTSYAGDNSKRNALRQAYNSEELYNLGIQRVFLLAKVNKSSQNKNEISQAEMESEAQKFKDIVQANFLEAYRNLTSKHMMGLSWCVEKCRQVSYIMKTDDDIVVNLYEILDKLKNIKNNSIAGFIFRNSKPIRVPPSKWLVSKGEYCSSHYPPYASGWLYLTTVAVASKLINKAKCYQHYFWIDDVYVTGMLRQETDIDVVDINEMYTFDFKNLECCIEGGKENLKCDFTIGPCNNDASLHVRFKKFAQVCQTKCKSRTENLKVVRTCNSVYKEKNLEQKRFIFPS